MQMSLEEMVKRLRSDLQEEVRDFVQYLINKKVNRQRGTPQFKWAGALRDLRSQYTSVELQHRASRWRAGEQ